MADSVLTMEDRVAALGIEVSCEQLAQRDDIQLDEWSQDASHWRVTVTRDGGSPMTISYSMGSAHRRWKAQRPVLSPAGVTAHDLKRWKWKAGERVGLEFSMARKTLFWEEVQDNWTEPMPPDAETVLDCLAMDASAYDSARNFEAWASELGYDTDSPRVERVYNVVAAQAKELRHLLGEHYDAVLYETERM